MGLQWVIGARQKGCAPIFFKIIDKMFCGINIPPYLWGKKLIKHIKMTESVITKTLKKVGEQSEIYSIGFKRLTSLPVRVRKNINLACILKGESNDDSMKKFLGDLTDGEFILWLSIQ